MEYQERQAEYRRMGVEVGKAWSATPQDARDYSVTRAATRASGEVPNGFAGDFYRGFIAGAGYRIDEHGVVSKANAVRVRIHACLGTGLARSFVTMEDAETGKLLIESRDGRLGISRQNLDVMEQALLLIAQDCGFEVVERSFDELVTREATGGS